MRIFFLFLSFSIGQALAQSYSDLAQELERNLSTNLMRARASFENDPDGFTQEHGRIIDRHLENLTSLHERLCSSSASGCPSSSDFQLTLAQHRIEKGVIQRRNEWRKEGLSSDVVASREEIFRSCAQSGQGCSDLPEADRNVASEVSTTPEVTVTTPEVTVTTPEVTVTTPDVPVTTPDVPVTTPDVPVTTPEVTVTTPDVPVTTPDVPVTTPEEESSVNEDENNPRNYDPDSCEWVQDLPKKIVNGPGCSSTNRSRICTGYVICNQKEGGGKFIRMSSCRAEFCGPTTEDAVNCTKDMRYFSEKPWGEEKLFMTKKVKKVLSSEQ